MVKNLPAKAKDTSSVPEDPTCLGAAKPICCDY